MKIDYNILFKKFLKHYDYKTTIAEKTLMTDFAMFVVQEIGVSEIKKRLIKNKKSEWWIRNIHLFKRI